MACMRGVKGIREIGGKAQGRVGSIRDLGYVDKDIIRWRSH